MKVLCIDNTMQRRVLEVGRVYEVTAVNDRDGYYTLGSLGEFSKERFVPVDQGDWL